MAEWKLCPVCGKRPEALSFRLFFYAKKLGRRGDIRGGHSFKILLSK
jgi:hypothetical protein